MVTALETAAGIIKVKRTALLKYYDKKGPDGTVDIDAAGRDNMKALNDELNVLLPKYEVLREEAKVEADHRKSLEEMDRILLPDGFHGGGGQGGQDRRVMGNDGAYLNRQGQLKGFGTLFTESSSYKSWSDARKSGGNPSSTFSGHCPDANLKTLFAETAGWSPFVNRLPGVTLSAQQAPKVVDLIPMAQTTQAAIKWMLETIFTSAAAPIAEGGTYTESQFQLAEQTTSVNKVGHTLPMTDEQLADVPGARDYLNGRMELGLKQRLDIQLLLGNGTAPQLNGLFNIAGIQTQILGADPVPDALYKAMTLIMQNAFADASGVIMHPQNWQDIRLLRTTQGLYIWGSPDSIGPQRVWGVPVVTTTYCTFGSALLADFLMYTQLYYRQGIDFEVTNSHASEFTSGIQRMRAAMRVAFVCFRPVAICQVTGMRSS
jgi:hypothetical protein